MAECDPQFDSTINFDCIRKLIREVRAGNLGLSVIQLILWIIGSLINVTLPTPSFADAAPAEPSTIEEALSNIEMYLDTTPVVTTNGTTSISPVLLAALVQLLIKLLGK
jgi:hypothetical protein